MNRPRIAALGVALALSPVAAWSAAGDAWYGTNRTFERVPVEVTRALPADTVVYEERVVTPRPVIVERRYIAAPRETIVHEPYDIVVLRDDRDFVSYLNPETGHRIGRGLFNTTGPNDFGS